MNSRLAKLIELVEVDEPSVVEPLKTIAAANPDAPLAEVWLRARRMANRSVVPAGAHG